MKGLHKSAWFTAVPMVFMIITTIAALFLLVRSNITKTATLPLAIVAIVLIILAVWLVVEAYNALVKKNA